MTSSRRGFSLVELLIVVLIISILAAIAVPNFLDAQVRAKLAKSKSGMKTLDFAIKMLQVDRGVMLLDHQDVGSGWGKKRIEEVFFGVGDHYMQGGSFSPLTTPVAYLIKIPQDPFIQNHVNIITAYTASLIGQPNKNFGYHDYDWEEYRGRHLITHIYQSANKPYQTSIKLLQGDYIISGVGPYNLLSLGEVDLYITGQLIYNITNGVMSFGNIICTSQEGFLE